MVKQINPAAEEKSHQIDFKAKGDVIQGLMPQWTLQSSEEVILQMLEVDVSLKFSLLKIKRGKNWETVFPATAVSA